jgi:hypothetical protein
MGTRPAVGAAPVPSMSRGGSVTPGAGFSGGLASIPSRGALGSVTPGAHPSQLPRAAWPGGAPAGAYGGYAHSMPTTVRPPPPPPVVLIGHAASLTPY